MSARLSYDDVRSAAAAARADFSTARAAVAVSWQDGAARRAEADLRVVEDQLEALCAAVEQQSRAHTQVEQLCDLVARQVEEADERVDDAQTLLWCCQESLRAADGLAVEVGSALSAGEGELARALALVGRAGSGPGSIIGVEVLEARIAQGIGNRYRTQAVVMMAKAGAVELLWNVGPNLVNFAPRIDLPDGWDKGLREAVETAAPVVPAQISEVVRRFREVWHR